MKMELRENEIILNKRSSDYYKKSKFLGIHFFTRKRGKLFITNERVIIKSYFSNLIVIESKELKEIKRCYIGFMLGTIMIPIFPIGIDLILENGEEYKVAVSFGREKTISFIEKLINKD